MKDATIKSLCQNTYHRDGTVSFWSIFSKQWLRISATNISDEVLTSMTPRERERIAKIKAKEMIRIAAFNKKS